MDTLKSLMALGKHVAAEQDESLSATDLGDVRQRLLKEVASNPPEKRHRRRTSLAVGALAAAALATAAAAFAALNFGKAVDTAQLQVTVAGEPVEHEALDNWWSAPADASLPIEFSDGTRVGLKPKSRARVLQVGQHGAHIVLESGASRFDVVPKESANWQVSAGPFLVQVVGTSFDLEWGPDDDLFVLRLHKGKVNLSGCLFGSGRSVIAGETVRASCKSHHYEIATRDSTSGPKQRQASTEQPVASASATQKAADDKPLAVVSRAPNWRELARDGKYRDAIAAASEAGFGEELAHANAEDLALLGDAARFSGKPGKAVAAYEQLRARYPGTDRAATAAYSLARTYFDQRGAFSRAARWFQTYLTERPSGPLAREAQGRLMESLNSAGDRSRAQHTAASYLKRYPNGPHAALARSLTAKKP